MADNKKQTKAKKAAAAAPAPAGPTEEEIEALVHQFMHGIYS